MRRARPAWAAAAALTLATLLPGGAASAQAPGDSATLGRLFSTPQERAALDARRSGEADQPAASASADAGPGAATAPAPSAAGAAPAAPVKPPTVTLDGIVRRSDGTGTAWVNHEARTMAIDPQRRDRAAAGAVVRSERGVLTLKLASGKRVPLKPGQRYDLGDGSVKEDREP